VEYYQEREADRLRQEQYLEKIRIEAERQKSRAALIQQQKQEHRDHASLRAARRLQLISDLEKTEIKMRLALFFAQTEFPIFSLPTSIFPPEIINCTERDHLMKLISLEATRGYWKRLRLAAVSELGNSVDTKL